MNIPASRPIRSYAQQLFGIIGLSGNRLEKPAGRGVTVFPDDIFITSYPKSGNTWCRFIYSCLTRGEQGTYTETLAASADIYWFPDRVLRALPQPRVLKSHEYFDPRYPRVVYVVRDVRSVIVSYHDFLARAGVISSDLPYLEFTRQMLAGKLDRYGSWQDNVMSWVGVRGNDRERFCLIRYEDLRSNGRETVRNVARFLGQDFSDAQLDRALEMSSLDRMRTLEQKEESQREDESDAGRKDLSVVRSGLTDGWRSVLDQKTLACVEKHCRDVLERLGYQW